MTLSSISPPPTAEDAVAPASKSAPLVRSLLISVATLAALLSFVQLDLAACGAMLSRIDATLVLAMALVYLAMYALRALRLRIVLPAHVGFVRLAGAVMVHQFYATFLPMKVGELALPMLLKRDGIRRAQTLGILLVLRVFDLTVMALLLGIALLLLRRAIPASLTALWPVQVVALATSIVCIVVLLKGPRASLVVMNYIGRWRQGEEHAPGWFAGRIDDLDQALRTLSMSKVLLGGLVTVGICSLAAAYGVLFCQRVVPEIPLTSLVVVCIAMPLVSQIPVQGLAGIGTTQAIMLGVFVLAGLPQSDALSLGIVSHAVQLAFVSGVGLVGMALRRGGEQRGDQR